jgi:hypothetical protein
MNEHGVPFAQIKVDARVRLVSFDDEVSATVVRMDTPTFGVVEVRPEHQMGEPYRALFSAHNVIAILP